MKKDLKLALCQMKVSDNKEENTDKALKMLAAAAGNGAYAAVLPEMFSCPYDIKLFAGYAEKESESITLKKLSNKAKDLEIYVIGGSIPERDGNKIYNTCYVFDRSGKIIGKHRKIHLFDVSIKDKITFKESEVLCAGDEITVVDIGICKIGVAICYDIRFPEISRIMTLRGADVLIFPGAFNLVTGPAHWELIVRARAVDNQIYAAAVSPARNSDSAYIAYGRSMAADPWGEIIAMAGTDEEIVFTDLSVEKLKRIRSELPLLKHRREDIYQK